MAVSCKRTAGIVIRIAMLMMSAIPVLAQKNPVYSLADLVDSASRHLPVLLQKRALVSSAEAGITEARHAFLPKVNVVEELSIGTDNDLSGTFLPMAGLMHNISGGVTAANNYQPATSNIASVYGEYELVNFGLRGAKVNNAKAFAGLSKADLSKELYLVKWQIGKVYFEILKSRSQLTVDEEDIRRYQSMYTISVALTRTGINAGVDSSLAKAGLSQTRVKYNQAMGTLLRLQQQLAFLTGIDSPQIRLDTSWHTWEEPVLDGIRGDSLNNPLADYYARQQLQYRAEQELIRKSYLPKIILGAGGWARGSSIQYSNDYKSLGEGMGYQRLNYTAGIGITYDLFNGVRKKDRLTVAGYQADAADHALQQQVLSLRSEAIQAGETIKAALKNLAELPVQLQAATDAYNQKLAQYKAGMINLVDLVNASFVLYQSQSAYIETLSDWYTASLDKAATTGNLDQFIQTLK
ncbi:MAG TPA: TolC family protein [Puia sp.]|nr:TolC family protein [Puia sp.]